MLPVTDLDLLTRWKSGDETAFTALVERHQPMVVAVARRVVGEHHAAEDVAQATFLVLARKADSLSGGGSDIGGWLHRVARDLARDRRSADGVRRRHEGAARLVTVDADPVATAAQRSEFLDQFDDAIAALPERQRTCLVLHHLEGLPVTQVAVRLGSPEGSVCQWLSRGRERLRQILQQRGVVVSASLLLALLADNSLAAAETVAPLAPASAAAKALAEGYVRQQAWHALAWLGGAAAAGLAVAGLLVAWRETPPPAPVARPALPPPPAPGPPERTIPTGTDPVLIVGNLPLRAPAAADDSGAKEGFMVSIPGGFGQAGAGVQLAVSGRRNADITPLTSQGEQVTLTREQAVTLGVAAKVLSTGTLVVQVDASLADLPIPYPADGRFSGLARIVVKQIVASFRQQPVMSIVESITVSNQGGLMKETIRVGPGQAGLAPAGGVRWQPAEDAVPNVVPNPAPAGGPQGF